MTEPVALLFPGQGSQARGMGKLVYDHSAAARRTYEEASEITGMDIARLCFEADEDELSETSVTQPAVLTTSVAFAAAMREKLSEVGRLMRPRLFGGHSLGLFSAAVASEAIEFRDAMVLIMERARLMGAMNKERPVGMASVIGLGGGTMQELCEQATASPLDRVDVANYNLDTQIVISGDVTALERAMESARSLRAKVIRLKVKVSSHTPLHVEQAEEFAQVLGDVEFRDPQRPVVSNITSQPLATGAELGGEFAAQLCSSVYWAANVREMARQGVDHFIEAGPGHVLARLVRRIPGDVVAVSLADAKEAPVPISILPATATVAAELPT
ncbi:MAG TPA: ACP S-malonyltransferase [Dehalococcoidia bacterium]|nr:ACP S-malonyltransferase [Dehalococcoidia bacterium]